MPEKELPPRLSATLCLGPTLAPFIADRLMYGIMNHAGLRERERERGGGGKRWGCDRSGRVVKG